MATRVVLNGKGFRDLLQSAEVQKALEAEGEKIRARAGDGYEVEAPFVGKSRARVTVRTATPAARVDDARNHTLLRALGGRK